MMMFHYLISPVCQFDLSIFMLQPGVYTKSSDKNAKSSYAPGFITVSLIVAAALTLIIVMHMK
ncbi:MAG TPA: hypothetical protein DEF35_12505 [Paenibacillus sp.]|nr:hypothetical protein P363_0125865 [Paenibacillus sp. MAEPY1]HBU82445.1 hypothetical protein [Paenibacillus sp.]